MFNDMPEAVRDRMQELEQIDARDRSDGTTRLARLRQIPSETGKFIALLAATAPAGRYIEIGTSAGYSTLWLALARRTFDMAGVGDVVHFVHGNALDALPSCSGVSFCFLDAEKEIYAECYESVIPNMAPGGILVADNAINHEATLRPMLDRALSDDRVDALVVPVGKGELVCRKKGFPDLAVSRVTGGA